MPVVAQGDAVAPTDVLNKGGVWEGGGGGVTQHLSG